MRRTLRALGAALLTSGLGVVLIAAPAQASVQHQTITQSFTGSTNPNVDFQTTAVCDACYPDAFGPGPGSWAFGASVDTTVTDLSFAPSTGTQASYDDTLLRQGQTMPIADTLTPVSGTMSATGAVDVQYGAYNDPTGGTNWQPSGTLTPGTVPFNTSFTCDMPLPGDPAANCTSSPFNVPVASITVIQGIPFVTIGLDIDLSVNVTLNVTINGAGVATLRSIQVVGGSGADTAPLNFGGSSPSTVNDSVHFPCTQPAGNDVNYSFTNTGYSPDVDLSTTTAVHFEATMTDVPPVFESVGLFGGDLGSVTNPTTGLSLALAAPDQTINLGALAKNNVPPVADAGNGGVYSGNEGTPISFDGSGSSSVCGFPTLQWNFSDGGVAYGPNPQHTFEGPGTYSGLLTATDATGLTNTTTFTVNVADVAPTVNAGPNVGAAWGMPVSFNGSAVDAGSNLQSTLSYSWDFGDGSPSASGGPSVVHSYSSPGDYLATLTVCDSYDLCSASQTHVTIRKRNVTASYTGNFSGTYNTASSLNASLTDEFGNPVQGRTVSFTYGGSPAGSASTSSSGNAHTAFTPLLSAGSYPVGVGFTGDSLYNMAPPAGGTYVEGLKGTSVSYSGATSGGPNKTVTLSAVLTDATGQPLAGRTITFKLGTQTVSAVTNANGVATTSLKLSQKIGSYALTATFAPSGADAGFYTGGSAASTFSLK